MKYAKALLILIPIVMLITAWVINPFIGLILSITFVCAFISALSTETETEKVDHENNIIQSQTKYIRIKNKRNR